MAAALGYGRGLLRVQAAVRRIVRRSSRCFGDMPAHAPLSEIDGNEHAYSAHSACTGHVAQI